MSIGIYIAVMALVTYLVRVIPFAAVRGQIKSRFIKSFLYYIPYTVLSAMTFPAIFYSTGNTISSAAGTVTAVIMAYFRLPLIIVAFGASAAAYITGLFV
ncbi:MAG: AzlD domain-containing protein [Huintestinicola sp.]